MVQCLIFDFDGLIYDTETYEFRNLQNMFREHGSELTIDVWGHVIGTQAGFNPILYLQEQLGRELDEPALQAERRQRFNAMMENVGAMEGVVELLQAAQKANIPCVVASSSSSEWVNGHLAKLGLHDYFAHIITKEAVERVKPAPDLFLKAAEVVGVNPAECVIFEDSVNGAIAAKAAGIPVVIVPNEVTVQLAFPEVDLMVKSLKDVTVERLTQLVQVNR